MVEDERRLAALLTSPQETLSVEIKEWLDLGNRAHQAVIAKAAIALANYGGGYIVLGFEEAGEGFVAAKGRPQTLSAYNNDRINGIIERCAEPPFHCDVRAVRQPGAEELFPIIIVPGGHRTPIRSKKDGPNGEGIRNNVYYTRRPGPKSESPQSSQEWDDLIQRCVRAGRDDLLNSIRHILSGRASDDLSPSELVSRELADWTQICLSRWQDLIEDLPEDSASRCSHGFWSAAYTLQNVPARLRSPELLDIMSAKAPQYTGWPPWRVPMAEETRPHSQGDGIECWFGRDPRKNRDPALSDFWRASPRGAFFLLRGYQEDGPQVAPDTPGTIFSIVYPIWRVGECLRHAARMADAMVGGDTQMQFRLQWTGLQGRWLRAPSRLIFWEPRQWTSDETSLETEISIHSSTIDDSLAEIVHELLSPLYEKFDFWKLPMELVARELETMLSLGSRG